MEPNVNLDLGELQNLLQSLTSPTIPTSNQITIPMTMNMPTSMQAQIPTQMPIQSPDLNSQSYQQSVYNQSYHSNYNPPTTHQYQYQTNSSSSSSTTTTTSTSLSALLSNLSSPVNPGFSPPLPSSSRSSTNDIFNLINALQPVSRSQYYQDHHQFQSNPTTPLSARSSLSRSRDEFNQDSSNLMPYPKKPKLVSPPLTPTTPREDTPDLSYTHQNQIQSHSSHLSSSGDDQDQIQSTSFSSNPLASDYKHSPPPNKSDHENVNKTSNLTSTSSSSTSKDLTQLKFSQALPILTKLIETDSFLDAFQDMKEKQEEFELRLLDERNRLKNENERTIKQAELSGKSATEIRRCEDNMKIELKKFDQSALIRWDSLKSQQQLTLQNLGVPTFCLTKDPKIIKRQHQVLEVIISSSNDRETNLDSEE